MTEIGTTETITATGTGTWYLAYEIELVTVNRHFRSRYSSDESSTTHYELRCRKPGETRFDSRIYETEIERSEFIKESFSEITLQPIPNPPPTPCDHVLSPNVGEHLSAVTFVMDYIQIQFNCHHLNAYGWPVVWIDDQRYDYGKTGYRDAICSLISKNVTRFEEYLDVGLVFEFNDSCSLEIPTSDSTGNLIEDPEYYGPAHI